MENVNLIFSSAPQSLIHIYCDMSLHHHDIVFDYVSNNQVPIYQSVLYQYIAQCPFEFERNRQNTSIRQLLESYGYQDVYVIPLPIRGSSNKVSFSVLSKNLDVDNFRHLVEQSKPVLRQLGCNIQSIGTKKFPKLFACNQNRNHSVLTKRQTQILDVLAKQAKTSQQVADRLNISVRTVNKHIECAKEALGALSTSNAIYLAIKDNLISVDL